MGAATVDWAAYGRGVRERDGREDRGHESG
jgi:hypothetical protein